VRRRRPSQRRSAPHRRVSSHYRFVNGEPPWSGRFSQARPSAHYRRQLNRCIVPDYFINNLNTSIIVSRRCSLNCLHMRSVISRAIRTLVLSIIVRHHRVFVDGSLLEEFSRFRWISISFYRRDINCAPFAFSLSRDRLKCSKARSCEASDPFSDVNTTERISTSMNFSAISVASSGLRDCGSLDPATLILIAAIQVARANELVIRNEICRAA